MFPWYTMTLLAFEANDVIGLRLLKLAAGDRAACDEAQLMVAEKMDAVVEAGTTLVSGGSFASVIDRYREHVAANRARLLPA